jgi:hypothetical protein
VLADVGCSPASNARRLGVLASFGGRALFETPGLFERSSLQALAFLGRSYSPDVRTIGIAAARTVVPQIRDTTVLRRHF